MDYGGSYNAESAVLVLNAEVRLQRTLVITNPDNGHEPRRRSRTLATTMMRRRRQWQVFAVREKDAFVSETEHAGRKSLLGFNLSIIQHWFYKKK